jgi:aspartyl-tRNA(Asn)/glutamyl-tRNA(Gln) amidotransferase subunit B
LAHEKCERFQKEYGLPEYDAEVLTAEKKVAEHWEKTVKLLSSQEAKKISNLYMTHLLKLQKSIPETFERITPETVAKILEMTQEGKISLNMAKEVLDEIAANAKALEDIIKEKGFVQISDTSTLEATIDKILADNPDNVAAYKGGKDKLFGFFVGQTMKALGGKANPKLVNEILRKKLSS